MHPWAVEHEQLHIHWTLPHSRVPSRNQVSSGISTRTDFGLTTLMVGPSTSQNLKRDPNESNKSSPFVQHRTCFNWCSSGMFVVGISAMSDLDPISHHRAMRARPFICAVVHQRATFQFPIQSRPEVASNNPSDSRHSSRLLCI